MDHLFYFVSQDFWRSPWLVALFIGSLFLIVLARYLFAAWLYAFALRRLVKRRRITRNLSGKSRRNREIGWATLSSLIFAVLATLCYFAYQAGLTRVYEDVFGLGLAYFFFSILLILFLYETYYYWLHRWMHSPRVFRIVHRVHHESIHTSVFTSFSFHPLEAVLQFIFLPVIVLIIPVHYVALAIVLLLMTISAVVNHAGVEVFPRGFHSHPVGRWVIGATHHDIHHKNFRKNFGLYFTFWDKWMNTESPEYGRDFVKNTE